AILRWEPTAARSWPVRRYRRPPGSLQCPLGGYPAPVGEWLLPSNERSPGGRSMPAISSGAANPPHVPARACLLSDRLRVLGLSSDQLLSPSLIRSRRTDER